MTIIIEKKDDTGVRYGTVTYKGRNLTFCVIDADEPIINFLNEYDRILLADSREEIEEEILKRL